jgi:hypothetical protein
MSRLHQGLVAPRTATWASTWKIVGVKTHASVNGVARAGATDVALRVAGSAGAFPDELSSSHKIKLGIFKLVDFAMRCFFVEFRYHVASPSISVGFNRRVEFPTNSLLLAL